MKTSIAIINSAICLKSGNGVNGYNFYSWLKDTKPENVSLVNWFIKISYAGCTENSCKSKFSL